MFQFLVLCSMGIITVSGTMQVFEAPNLSNSQPINVNVHSEIPVSRIRCLRYNNDKIRTKRNKHCFSDNYPSDTIININHFSH